MLLSSVCNAHQDAWIKHENDKLIGLPEKYQPARFSYESTELRIGTNSVVIPAVIWKLFGDTKRDDNKIIFTASWYHSEGLPPYMVVRNRNCELLINLDTLSIIDFMRDDKITISDLAEWEAAIKKLPQSAL